jgi:hypothetical protein
MQVTVPKELQILRRSPRQTLPLRRFAAALLFALGCGARAAHAIIVTGPQGRNTGVPGGTLTGSGYQYEGFWNGVLGTAIAPHYFLTAAHVGGSIGGAFTLGGIDYTALSETTVTGADLAVWQVAETLPLDAPLYGGSDEVGQSLVVYGRGVARGDILTHNGAQIGWNWGAYDGAESWGTNQFDGVVNVPGLGDLLTMSFNAGGDPNTGILAPEDSGGAAFVNNAGVWELAGINYGIQVFYDTPPPTGSPAQFSAAIDDARGLYDANGDGTYTYIDPATHPSPVPQSAALSRVSANRAAIESITGTTSAPEPAALALLFPFAAVPWLWRRRR